MFNKHEEMTADSAGDVVLLLVEENAFEGIYVQLVRVSVLGAENGVTKRKKPRRVVEVRPENRVTIARVVIYHKIHLDGIVARSKRLIHRFFVKSDFALMSVYGTDKGGLGKSS